MRSRLHRADHGDSLLRPVRPARANPKDPVLTSTSAVKTQQYANIINLTFNTRAFVEGILAKAVKYERGLT